MARQGFGLRSFIDGEHQVTGEKTVDIGLGAKVSLEAKVSTEIPPQSTGRLLDALTDIIRPFSERRGLKADQVRLQREEVLIEIAHRVHHRSEVENQSINPLPNKFLVPFLEKASLEELDSVMIDRWADLLLSSALDPSTAHPRYVQILSELGGREAQLLREIALNGLNEASSLSFRIEMWEGISPLNLRDALSASLKPKGNLRDMANRFQSHITGFCQTRGSV